MRIILACPAFLAATFFGFSFLLGLFHIARGKAHLYADKHGWPALIAMQVAMLVLAALFFWLGRVILRWRRNEQPH
jgi:uncharacterized membrane protein SpoIIM required for sporulation